MSDIRLSDETFAAVLAVTELIEAARRSDPTLALALKDASGIRVTFDTYEAALIISARMSNNASVPVAAISFHPQEPDTFGVLGVPITAQDFRSVRH
jgi:hypothetical protein